jgi:AAA+ ATPase superfamily predicted ATPase
MKKVVVAVLLASSMLLHAGVMVAAEGPTREAAIEQEIKLLRQDLRTEKKKIVAANMQLTEAEALKFWPVYDAYTLETIKSNDALQALIKEYAQNVDTMTDEKIKSLTKRTLELDEAVTKLRMKYVPLFTKAVAAKKTARFMQIDRRLGLLMNLQVASGIPLVQP